MREIFYEKRIILFASVGNLFFLNSLFSHDKIVYGKDVEEAYSAVNNRFFDSFDIRQQVIVC